MVNKKGTFLSFHFFKKQSSVLFFFHFFLTYLFKGGTLLECRKALVTAGAAKTMCFCTHACFPENSYQKFIQEYEKRIKWERKRGTRIEGKRTKRRKKQENEKQKGSHKQRTRKKKRKKSRSKNTQENEKRKNKKQKKEKKERGMKGIETMLFGWSF